MLKIIIGIISAYLLICLSVWFLQRFFIYHPSAVPNGSPSRINVPQFNVETLRAKDGVPLEVWWEKPEKDKPVIMYFHGNAGNFADRAITMKPYLKQGYGILGLEYRGYASNPGKPNEKAFYQDANTAFEFVLTQSVKPHCIIFYGESLGSGVATEMAYQHNVGALVLQAPFSSLANIARTHYAFLPSQLLLREKYDNFSKIAEINMPLLILHGTNDKVVPIKEGKRLFEKANEVKVFKTYPGAHHNDLITSFQADQDVIAFINQYIDCEEKQPFSEKL